MSFICGAFLLIQACGGGGGGSSTPTAGSGDTFQLGADGLCYDETIQQLAPNYTYCSALSTYNSGVFYIANGVCIDSVHNVDVSMTYCTSNPFVWQNPKTCFDSYASQVVPNIYCLPPHSPVYLNAGVCYYTDTQQVDPYTSDCTEEASPIEISCYGNSFYSYSIVFENGAYFDQWTPVSCPGIGSYCSGEVLYTQYGVPNSAVLCQ